MSRLAALAFVSGLLMILSSPLTAQKKASKENFKENHNPFGKKKKEKRNQKGTSGRIRRGGLFAKHHRSMGNANAFAKHSTLRGGGGLVYKIFHPFAGGERNASLRKTRPGKVQNREQKKLFKRLMTTSKGRHEKIQKRQRRERQRGRRRGNEVFNRKKR